MERLGVREAKEHFSDVLNNLDNSGPVLITRSGFPTAIIFPITGQPPLPEWKGLG
ncbi:MAG: type II toxin-antitoxin system Phd/YefM family antitoxin [Actinobacteria bacterium]|nr:type II toxin-antitoxin system Phd/YefM family antitoxin [Actinomycetota bacterium]MBU4490588.1 type II toxin-antitoxin system Phd/YefM family antitoxin [Actinomycetota bacterium]